MYVVRFQVASTAAQHILFVNNNIKYNKITILLDFYNTTRVQCGRTDYY